MMKPFERDAILQLAKSILSEVKESDPSLGEAAAARLAKEIWSFIAIQNDVARSRLMALCEAESTLQEHAGTFGFLDLPGDHEWPIEQQRSPE